MAWDTPKTDWGVDVVGSADMNRIENNCLGARYGYDDLGTGITAAASIVITKDYHEITGTATAIDFMSTTGYYPGAVVRLRFMGNGYDVNINHDTASPPANYAAFYLTLSNGGHGNYNGGPDSIYEFLYNGTYWINVHWLYYST